MRIYKMKNSSLILGLSLVSLNACFSVTIDSGKQQKPAAAASSGGSANSAATEEHPSGEAKGEGRVVGDAPQSTIVTTVGVKNAEQIMRSMAKVSGIDPYQTGTYTGSLSLTPSAQNISIFSAFDLEYKGVMPSTNSIGAFNSNAQIAVVKLAWSFCDALGGRNQETGVPQAVLNARAAVFGTGHAAFLAGNANTISDMKTQVVMPLIDKFWMDGIITDQQVEASYSEMVTLGNTIASRNVVTVPARTDALPKVRDVVRAVCTAALSASPTVLY
jgi:hypothetical protein